MRVAQLPDRLIYLGVIAVLVGLNLFLIWPSKPVPDDAPPPVDVSSRTASASSSPEPTAQLPRATVPRVDPAGDLNRADWAVVFPGNDPPASLDEAMPFLLGRMGDLTPAQEARYNALHVVPWRPDSLDDDDSEAPSRDEYYAALRAESELLADDDPRKYLLLASFETTIEGGVNHFLVAAALSGKPGDLLGLAYAISPAGNSPEADVRALQYRYVLTKLASALGDERALIGLRGQELRQLVADHGGDASREIRAADVHAAELLTAMIGWHETKTGLRPAWRLADRQ